MHTPSRRIAFLFPGQGAQYPGMGADFAAHYPLAKQTFEEADDLLGRALSQEIFHGSRERLKETCTSQLALYVVCMALFRVIRQLFPDLTPDTAAGLSLGEYTALTAAGILPFSKGVPLVHARATAMHEACLKQRGSMEVVMGLTPLAVQEAIHSLASRTGSIPLWVANLNAPGQVVISGSVEALAALRPLLEQGGAKRILTLEVAGAFHSGLMQPAQDALAGPISQCALAPATCRLVMNVPGDFVHDTTTQRHHLLQQVTKPVLWEQGIRNMEAAGITHYVEIGPGKTLSGMLKRTLPHRPSITIEKIADLTCMESLYA